MLLSRITYYAKNCFWLLIPALILDVVFRASLPATFQPDMFWADIPLTVSIPENALRTLVFALAAFMPFTLQTRQQKTGFLVYILGLVLYAASWAVLIVAPQSPWSLSLIGYLAPAYTPLIWIGGIGLIGDRLFLQFVPYKQWMYLGLTLAFICFHIAHASLVYFRHY